MPPFCTTGFNPDILEDFSNSTSDVLLDSIEEVQADYCRRRQLSNFSRWPIRMARDVTSFKDANLLELDIPSSETDFTTAPVFIVVSAPQGKPKRMFQVCDRLDLSSHDLYFFPDFYNIKKWISHVLQTAAFTLEQHEDARQSTTTTITPQVIVKANEENLTEDIKTSVKLAEESYTTLKGIHVDVESDPEIVDRETIRFTLAVSGKPETVLEDETRFKRCLRSNIDTHARELITITYIWEN